MKKEEKQVKNYNGAFYGRQTPTKYEIQKERARDAAIDWQIIAGTTAQSWQEVATATNKFYKLAKRYGLIKEFKTNGII